MQAFEELKKKIKDIETQSLAMDGCSPSFSVSDILSIIDSVGKDIDVTTTDTISQQAAIDALADYIHNMDKVIGTGRLSAYDCKDAATSVLAGVPSAQPLVLHCTDCEDWHTKQGVWGISVSELPSAQPEPQWIPFKTRPLTEAEKEEYPEWNCILDCKLPDDGQTILVSINLRGHERVQYDEFYTDDGSYLDSGYAIGTEATAWMPLPEPYEERREE